MTERYSEISDFDADAMSATLGAESRSTHDVAHGAGEVLTVGGTNTQLEIYPDAGVTRVTRADDRVELFRVPGYSLDPDAGYVIFEHGPDADRTRLLVRGDGKVFFGPVLRALEPARTDETATNDALLDSAPAAVLETSTAIQEGSPGPAANPESAEDQQVQLRGRLGKDPWFASGEESEVIGVFPLAVNAEGRGATTWHRVITFGETADQLRQNSKIKKGSLVDVTGQHVAREEQTESGRTRRSNEFHATSVTRVTATRVQPQRS